MCEGRTDAVHSVLRSPRIDGDVLPCLSPSLHEGLVLAGDHLVRARIAGNDVGAAVEHPKILARLQPLEIILDPPEKTFHVAVLGCIGNGGSGGDGLRNARSFLDLPVDVLILSLLGCDGLTVLAGDRPGLRGHGVHCLHSHEARTLDREQGKSRAGRYCFVVLDLGIVLRGAPSSSGGMRLGHGYVSSYADAYAFVAVFGQGSAVPRLVRDVERLQGGKLGTEILISPADAA